MSSHFVSSKRRLILESSLDLTTELMEHGQCRHRDKSLYTRRMGDQITDNLLLPPHAMLIKTTATKEHYLAASLAHTWLDWGMA